MVDKAQDSLNMASLKLADLVANLVDVVSNLEKRIAALERGEHPVRSSGDGLNRYGEHPVRSSGDGLNR